MRLKLRRLLDHFSFEPSINQYLTMVTNGSRDLKMDLKFLVYDDKLQGKQVRILKVD